MKPTRKCEHCPYESIHKKQLDQHMNKEHPDLLIPAAGGNQKSPNATFVVLETEELKCCNCEFTGANKKSLARHISDQHPKLPIPKPHGHGKKPAADHLLPKDERNKSLTAVCGECKRRFLNPTALDRHSRSKHRQLYE